MIAIMVNVEWVGGPWDGSVFDAPDGCTSIEISLSPVMQPDHWKVVDEHEVPVPTVRTLSLPIHVRLSDGAFVVKYSEITDD